MDNQSNIERVVMRRVYLIRVLGLIISTVTFAILTFVLALWGIGKEVWVARIFQNMPHSGDLAATSRFYLDAFGHTRLIVQALTLLSLAAFIYLARKTVRALSSFFTPSHV